MQKLFILLCAAFLLGKVHAQPVCDTATVETIVNMQLKKTEKQFRRPFTLASTAAIPGPTDKYPGTDTIYNRYCLNTPWTWDGFNLHSKFMKREQDTARTDYRVTVSAPVFDSNLLNCRFIVTVSYSEWGGKGYMVYYRKKGNRWKLVRMEQLWNT